MKNNYDDQIGLKMKKGTKEGSKNARHVIQPKQLFTPKRTEKRKIVR